MIWRPRSRRWRGFRNLLVHQYADVDPEQVWEIIGENLDDVDRYLAIVAALLPGTTSPA